MPGAPPAAEQFPLACVRGPFLFVAVLIDSTASAATLDAYRRTWLSRLLPQRRRPLAPTVAQYRFFAPAAPSNSRADPAADVVVFEDAGGAGHCFRHVLGWASHHVGIPQFFLTVDLRSTGDDSSGSSGGGDGADRLAYLCLDRIIEELR